MRTWFRKDSVSF